MHFHETEDNPIFLGRLLEEAAPSSAPSTNTTSSSSDAAVIRRTLQIYGSIYLAVFLIFAYVRRKFPKYYNLRSWVPEMECDLAKTSQYPGWFSWTYKVMSVDDNQLLENIGMDGLCFVRCLRLGAKLSFGGVLNSIWLIPLFLTADNEPGYTTVTDKFAKISVANLAAGSPRMAGVVLAAYIILFYALHLITKELDWYADFRHKFLARRDPRNYAIYVSGIPENLRSDFALGDYFRSWSSPSAVFEAHMAMDTPSLDAYVAKREILIEKLEHALASEKLLGVKVQHRTFSFKNIFRQGAVTEKVESVAAYNDQLAKLNQKISFAIGRVTNRNDRMRQFMSKQPASSSEKLARLVSLSPIGENDDTAFFKPEMSVESDATDNRSKGEDGDIDSEVQPNSEIMENAANGYSPEDVSPPHPFFQLMGMANLGGVNQRHLMDSPETNNVTDASDHSTTQFEQKSQTVDVETGFQSDSEPDVVVSGSEIDDQNLVVDASHVAPNAIDSERESSNAKPKKQDLASGGSKKLSGSRSAGSIISRNVTNGAKKMTELSFGGVKHVKKVAEVGAQHALKAADLGLSGAKKAAEIGVSTLQYAPDFASTLKETAAFIAPVLAGKEEGAPKTAGFVVFRSLFACHAARQMLQHATATAMIVEAAPPPEEVFWRNVGLPDHATRTGRLLSFAATTSLCFFWSIPVAFISSLTAVDSLKQKLPTLAKWVEEAPWLEDFLALLAPLILLALNDLVLPTTLKVFSTWEGVVGSPALGASTFVKLSAFVIIQTFFVSAISGSITDELANILDNPEDLVVLLGNSLTTQSSYFIQIVLVYTFMVQGLDLLRVWPVGLAVLRRFVGPRLTVKERRKTWKFVNSLEDPPEFSHAEVFAQMILFYVIFFVYAPIAPVTCIFLSVAFMICECGYRYHFIHNHKTQPDSGGLIFKGFTHMFIGSIFIGELTLMGTLGLKRAVYAVPALLPLLIITALYTVLIYPKKLKVAESLPILTCVELDRQRQEDGTGDAFLVGQYRQPSLKNKVLYPEEDFEP